MNHPRINRLLLAGIFTATAVVALAQTAPKPEPTLKLGDTAPPLKVGKWLKGKPAAQIGDGKIYVVEFWATWCGPCKIAMPHLSDLANRFKGKATFIGMNVWESRGAERNYDADVAKADKFVRMGGDMMDYNVAIDTAEADMAKTWMTASGQGGIPASFIIDGNGKILFIGHPNVGLEQAVELAVEGKLTIENGKQAALDQHAKFTEYSSLTNQHRTALQRGDYAAAIAASEKAAMLIPYVTEPIQMKVAALLFTDRPAARKLIQEAMKKHSNAPVLLSSLAKSLAEDAKAEQQDFDLARKLLNSYESRMGANETYMMPLFASVYFRTGDKDKAVTMQQRYVNYLANPTTKAASEAAEAARQRLAEAAKQRLAEYQAAGR